MAYYSPNAKKRSSKKSKTARTVTSKSGHTWTKTASGEWVMKGAKKATKGAGKKSKKSHKPYAKSHKPYATKRGILTKAGLKASNVAEKEIEKATKLLRAAKLRITGIPRSALEEILRQLKYVMDT